MMKETSRTQADYLDPGNRTILMQIEMAIKYLFLILILIGCSACRESEDEKPLNVIMLLVDDMGYGDISVHGNPIIRTPNFDSMHDQSAYFTNFAVSPTCAPTRAALLTGKHEFLSSVTHTIEPMRNMDTASVSIADLFQKKGYKTGLFGKWHLGQSGEYGPWFRGFEETLTVPGDNQRSHYDPVLLKNRLEERFEGYRTDILFNEAMKFISDKKDEAFFCYLATFSPHFPNIVPEKYSEPYEAFRNPEEPDEMFSPGFCGQISNIDENLGKLTAHLESLGLENNTLLIVLNDNGGTFGVDTFNDGRRGTKCTSWSGGTRAYCFWKWGKNFPAGERKQMSGHIDILPTLADLCDLEIPSSLKEQLEGCSLKPVLKNAAATLDKRRMQVHHVGRWDIPENWADHKYANSSVRWGNYTLVRIEPCKDPNCKTCSRALARAGEKTRLMYSKNSENFPLTEAGKWELFDIEADPFQEINLADDHPDIVKNMSDFYEKWWAKVEDHFEKGGQEEASVKRDFNANWGFVKSPAEWPDDFSAEEMEMEPVVLPHCWNADDMGPGLKNPYIGRGWYRKYFDAPVLQPGQRLLIEFEGVNNCHSVWVNGGYAGGRDGGFLTSLLDITDLLEEGRNTILVRADNSYDLKAAMPQNIGWNRYGGITRPVWLYIRDHAFIACAGVEIKTPHVSADRASTVVLTSLEETKMGGAALEIRHTLYSPAGKLVSSVSAPVTTHYSVGTTCELELPLVKRPELWSDLSPVLYTLRTEVLEAGRVIDSQENRLGYRFFNFDSEEGFTLNGRPTKLRGANIHIFFPGLGNALPERFHREDMKLMKKMGCNFMRSSHYPRPQAVLDACDELGILVMEELPYWHGSVRASGGEEAIENSSRLIRDMVRQHGNHPSIIAWNTVNEIMIAPAYKPGVGHLPPEHPGREAWRINPKEYPYLRRSLQRMVETFKEEDPDRPVSMVVGGQWEKNDLAGLSSVADIVAYNGGALNLPKAEFIGPKNGKSYTFKPDYFREIYPARVHIMSEGVLNDYFFERGDWEKEQNAWRVNAKYWSLINQRPWLCGGAMWCFTDYSYNGNTDLHGVLDRYRLPKDLFFFYEAMWADHPVLHILGHWNHDAGSSREVVLFTNCRDVELMLNGRSLGKGISCTDEYPGIKNAPLVWKDVAFQEGDLTATGRYEGREIRDSRSTAGKPERIMLASSNDTLMADGRDISYLDLTICDASGKRCYTNQSTLSVNVTGPARLAGPELITATAGLARIAIRSSRETGDVRVLVSGEGVSSGEYILKSKAR